MPGPTHLKVFVGSPSDVKAERDTVVRVLRRLEATAAFRGRVTLQVFTYDDEDAPIAMPASIDPQSGVVKYGGRPREHDFTIILLWSRMGTRLPPSNARPDGRRYESGTEWEYEDAKHGGKDVFVYLRTDAPPAIADDRAGEQLAKVRRFVDSFRNPDGSLAGFVQEFGERSPLEPLLDKQMQGVVRRWVERAERRRALVRFGATASVLALVGAGILIRVVTRPHVTFSLADSCTLRHFGDQQRGRLRVTYAVEGQSAAWARAQLALYAAPDAQVPFKRYDLEEAVATEATLDFALPEMPPTSSLRARIEATLPPATKIVSGPIDVECKKVEL
jgi:hypothetical protein